MCTSHSQSDCIRLNQPGLSALLSAAWDSDKGNHPTSPKGSASDHTIEASSRVTHTNTTLYIWFRWCLTQRQRKRQLQTTSAHLVHFYHWHMIQFVLQSPTVCLQVAAKFVYCTFILKFSDLLVVDLSQNCYCIHQLVFPHSMLYIASADT